MPSDDNEWNELFSGSNASVWVSARCLKEMLAFPAKDRAKIYACMSEMYCTMEDVSQIPTGKLNRNENRHGPKNRLVQAFKSYQCRVYGVEGSIQGKRAFFASCAIIKKDNKADRDTLKRAAERVDSVSQIKGAEV